MKAIMVLLAGPGFVGRGVRFKLLDSAQVDQIREEAAKQLPPSDEAEAAEVRQQVWSSAQKRMAIPAMVIGVTAKAGFKSHDELLALAETDWKKPTVAELTDSPETFFSAKEQDALGDMYFRYHVANTKEIDDILGKALEVTVD